MYINSNKLIELDFDNIYELTNYVDEECSNIFKYNLIKLIVSSISFVISTIFILYNIFNIDIFTILFIITFLFSMFNIITSIVKIKKIYVGKNYSPKIENQDNYLFRSLNNGILHTEITWSCRSTRYLNVVTYEYVSHKGYVLKGTLKNADDNDEINKVIFNIKNDTCRFKMNNTTVFILIGRLLKNGGFMTSFTILKNARVRNEEKDKENV